jgi:hypothetical protein
MNWIHECVSNATIHLMSSKDVGIRIRLERELRDAFQAACASESRRASDVLREFMRHFAAQHLEGRQKSLFSPPGNVRTSAGKKRS